jgi:hypothetical protein
VAIARVQSYYSHGSAASVATAFAGSVTAGNILVLAAQWASSTITLTSITKTAGTATIGAVTTISEVATSNVSSTVVWSPITGSGSLTLTQTLSGSANQNLMGWELSAADGISPINAHVGQRQFINSNATDFVTSTTLTTTVADCLLLGFFSGNSTVLVAGTNFTLQEANTGTWGGRTEYFHTTGTGALAATFTRTSGTDIGAVVQAIAVAPDAGGATGQPMIRRFGLSTGIGQAAITERGRSGGAVMRFARRRSGIFVPSCDQKAA